MGKLKELVDKGLLTQDDYDELQEDFEDLGYIWRHEIDPESIQSLIEQLEEIGAYDAAERLTEDLLESMVYWTWKAEEVYGVEVYYDPKVNRWRDWNTGEFVSSPVFWVRD
jgi:hypothetical protein